MTFRFSTFRQLLSVSFAVTHIACLALSIVLCPFFVSHGAVWIIGTLEVALAGLFVNSAFSKTFFSHSTSVMQELCSNFASFALSAVLALLVFSLQINDQELSQHGMHMTMGAWIKIIVIVLFSHFAYTTILVNLAMLTHFMFDQGIWKRDIDSSPSVFPFPVLISTFLSALLPRFFKKPDFAPLPFPNGPVEATPVIRMPCTIPGRCECPTVEKAVVLQTLPMIPMISDLQNLPSQVSTTSTSENAASTESSHDLQASDISAIPSTNLKTRYHLCPTLEDSDTSAYSDQTSNPSNSCSHTNRDFMISTAPSETTFPSAPCRNFISKAALSRKKLSLPYLDSPSNFHSRSASAASLVQVPNAVQRRMSIPLTLNTNGGHDGCTSVLNARRA
ncbi:hypothetical protein GYMLUDRAFT_629366 [Collybiopsis luxurians FD-317 M1]|nr:hypothetical protein GYMLUDRAFT_629366 [Collybiopsis luxurians FD-317 M1]